MKDDKDPEIRTLERKILIEDCVFIRLTYRPFLEDPSYVLNHYVAAAKGKESLLSEDILETLNTMKTELIYRN